MSAAAPLFSIKQHSLPLIERQKFIYSRNSKYLSLSNDDFMKNTKYRAIISRNLGEKSKKSEAHHHKSPFEEAKSEELEDDKEYIPYAYRDLHRHCHNSSQLPHIHNKSECDRLMTAFDKQREKRYYFTNHLTPVRVYIKYETVKIDKSPEGTPIKSANKRNQLFLRHSLGVSKKFLKEAANMRFVKETLSFIPTGSKYPQFAKLQDGDNESLKSVRSDSRAQATKLMARKKSIVKKSLI